MFWNKEPKSSIESCAHALFEAACSAMRRNGSIRVEDLIASLASICGELSIDACGLVDPRQHKLPPGSRVFSDRVNQMLTGDVATRDFGALPATSVFGVIRDKVLSAGYSKSDFPDLEGIFKHFAANIGKAEDWGKVPLAVPQEHQPSILPLQVTYEWRPTVDKVLEPLKDKSDRLRAATLALAEALIAVRDAIDHKLVLLLAFQVVNGMAKTAPMTYEAMESINKKISDKNKS